MESFQFKPLITERADNVALMIANLYFLLCRYITNIPLSYQDKYHIHYEGSAVLINLFEFNHVYATNS